MKVRVLLGVLLLAAFARAQEVGTTIGAANACATVDVTGIGAVGFAVTGTFSGTLTPQVVVRGQTAANTKVTSVTDDSKATTIISTGSYVKAVAGYSQFQLCFTSYASGSAVIYYKTTPIVNAALFSGGPLSDTTPVLYTNYGTANSTAALVQNTVGCNGFVTGPYGNTSTKVSYDVTTADNTSNSYDLAISNATSGALACHTGPLAGTSLFPATGIQTANWAASCTLAANTKYFIGLTSSAASPAAKLGGSIMPSFQTGNTCGSSTSATIPNPLNTIPSDSYAQAPIPALALHN